MTRSLSRCHSKQPSDSYTAAPTMSPNVVLLSRTPPRRPRDCFSMNSIDNTTRSCISFARGVSTRVPGVWMNVCVSEAPVDGGQP